MPKHAKWPIGTGSNHPSPAAAARRGKCFPFLGGTVGERFERACEVAELTGIVFHTLRNESLSRYAKRGLDVLRLPLVGGHRDARHLQRHVKLTAAGLAHE